MKLLPGVSPELEDSPTKSILTLYVLDRLCAVNTLIRVTASWTKAPTQLRPLSYTNSRLQVVRTWQQDSIYGAWVRPLSQDSWPDSLSHKPENMLAGEQRGRYDSQMREIICVFEVCSLALTIVKHWERQIACINLTSSVTPGLGIDSTMSEYR